VHNLNIAVVIEEIPYASINFGLLERAKSVLLLAECFVFLWLFLNVVVGIGVEMVMALVMFKIVDRVTGVIMSERILLFWGPFDDAHFLNDFHLASHLLNLQSTFVNFRLAEPQRLIVHLREHSSSDLVGIEFGRGVFGLVFGFLVLFV